MEHELPLPRSWQVQRLEDATWRVVPERRSRFWGLVMLLIAGFFQLIFLLLAATAVVSYISTSVLFWIFVLMLQGFSLSALWRSLLWIFGREEWLVGRDRLEVWTLLFGYQWKHRRKVGTLVTARTLGEGGHCYGLYTVSGGRAEMPTFNPRLMEGCSREDVRKAGAFLSDVTGWPLREWTA